MNQWHEVLIKEAERIVAHGEGKLEFCAGPHGKDKTLILITAGRRYREIVDKVELDD